MSNEIYIAKQETLLETKTKVEAVQNTLVETEIKVEAVQNTLSETNTKAQAVQNTLGKTNDSGGTPTTGTVTAKENAILTEVNKIGNTADTGATETAGTIMGKLNSLISSNGIKRIQRGMVEPNIVSTTVNVPIATVDIQKSMLVITPVNWSSSGTMIVAVTLNSSSIAITTSSQYRYSNIFWQVIEFN